MPLTDATLTCPRCGHRAAVVMPETYCLTDHVCTGCGTRLSAPAGECCVFCAYADLPCPPEQQARRDSCGACG